MESESDRKYEVILKQIAIATRGWLLSLKPSNWKVKIILESLGVFGVLFAVISFFYSEVTSKDGEIAKTIEESRAALNAIQSVLDSSPSRQELALIVKEKMGSGPFSNVEEIESQFRIFSSSIFDPRKAVYYRAKSIALQLGSRSSEALKALNEGLEIFPSDPALLYERAVMKIRLFQLPDATRDFDKAAQLIASNPKIDYPAALSVNLGLAAIEFEQNDYEAAHVRYKNSIEAARNALEKQRIDFMRIISLPNGKFHYFEFKLVSLSHETAIPMLRLQLILTLINLNRIDDAYQEFNKLALDDVVFELFSEYEVVTFRLLYASLLISQSRLDMAKQQLSVARKKIGADVLGFRPDELAVSLHYVEGMLHFAQHDQKLARNHLRRSLFLINTYFGESYKSEKIDIVHALTSIEMMCGQLDSANELVAELNRLTEERGTPRHRFNAAFVSSLLAYLRDDEAKMKHSILVLEENFGRLEVDGSLYHGFLLVARANLEKMEHNQAGAEALEARALELLQSDNAKFQDALISSLQIATIQDNDIKNRKLRESKYSCD